MLGDNLPAPNEVVALYKSKAAASDALRGSDIQVILDLPRENLGQAASDPTFAANWVRDNIQAYLPDVNFRYIAVGNEVIPGENAGNVLPAMQNIYNAVSSAGLQDGIKVSTSVSTGVLGVSYPPSEGSFSQEASSTMGPILDFLSKTRAPLLVNVYPYMSYRDNPSDIRLDYALFTAPSDVVQDGQNNYRHLFDAIVDSVYFAMEKAGSGGVPIVVSESGWPSDGGFAATKENAQTYNSNLVRHAAQGTPKRPGPLETYVFAMFNENKKDAGIEQNFGLFYPNQKPVYEVNFT
ncbi:hypothetical protein AMTR_s00053p00181850 [Amborella trichopoda]|uniref:Glucan endo-1,3-beta-D-glucosidase n=1 Tax=Amborella trichopoda TaxID=13333 RepID=W1P5E7_AMBTC|nr:hypothetical protein AMTR_s00053p00181850 [Amborella trichopoda]